MDTKGEKGMGGIGSLGLTCVYIHVYIYIYTYTINAMYKIDK